MENTYNTLFLDRDGVINVHRPGDYVKTVDEFVFIDGVLEALRLLSPRFRHIMLVTNQRGVSTGIMSQHELDTIHRHMTATIAAHGGRIDRIYAATASDTSHPDRKPNIGLALRAKQDFPDVDFANSFMVGDSLSDVQFANNAHIPAVLLSNKCSSEDIVSLPIYAHYPNLITFAKSLLQ